jgi:hypothetical protein
MNLSFWSSGMAANFIWIDRTLAAGVWALSHLLSRCQFCWAPCSRRRMFFS